MCLVINNCIIRFIYSKHSLSAVLQELSIFTLSTLSNFNITHVKEKQESIRSVKAIIIMTISMNFRLYFIENNARKVENDYMKNYKGRGPYFSHPGSKGLATGLTHQSTWG